MKSIVAIVIAAGLSSVAVSSASAAEGCGAGHHRGPAGRCRANAYAAPGGRVIGRHYAGHGYWDGHRYQQNRYRGQGGGWRYR